MYFMYTSLHRSFVIQRFAGVCLRGLRFKSIGDFSFSWLNREEDSNIY